MAPTKKAGKKGAAKAAPAGGKVQKAQFAKADWKEGFKKKTAGVSDMTLLTTITNDSINDNLKKRFDNAEIYTYIGFVLISVNPFRLLPIYTDEVLRSYRGKNRLEMPPHVYAIAESAYYKMTSYQENQCVIISGESGAGKTEAAKKIMEYIAAVAGDKGSGIDEIKQMVLATNPLLESFGCAKTLRNNNSSRHGKYLEIEFNDAGEPVGAMITNYLLEKGRVVGQIENERNFHIFYQFTKAASPAQREAFGIQEPSAYTYTSKANCLDVPGIDDVADWAETLQAMRIIGLSDAEQNDIFRCLAMVLWLGNAQFKENAEGNAEIRDTSVPEFLGYLLEVDPSQVIAALTNKTVETQRGGRRGSIYDSPLNVPQAGAARDALAKAIYNNLFEWIVERVNQSMAARQQANYIIGVLDIYGFEIFQDNSFEQLCINYVNEKLQQIFIELTLKAEQEEYVREQIKWTPIDFFNNKVVCDLIEEKRPPGVFAALNDACATAHADPRAADTSFVQRLGALSSNKHFESRGEKFIVKHYAGDVTYNVSGMTDKNKDTLNQDLWALIGASKNTFFQNLFPDRPDPSSKKRPPTAGDKIKQSANALVEKLMRSQPSYIRTIKPNQNRSPSEYDTKAILHQIKYLGLQENIRVRRAGFAYRNTFDQMVQRFYLLSPATSYAGDYIWTGDSKSGCQKILNDCGIAKDEWQMGVTKAFIRSPETLFALETMRDRYWHNMAARIQRAWRNYWRYKNEAAARIQRAWRKTRTGDDFLKLRDYGHTVLGGRKERRRFSLLGMRRYLGDYLDVGGKSAFGETLHSAAGISGAETVAFSSRAEILTSKFGRSSKLTPRFVVVTDKAVYILITQLVQGSPQTSCDRKIPLVTISSVGLSNLKDDWMVINVKNSEEADPVLVVPFKTEMVVHLLQRTGGSIQIAIGPTLDYQKKKGKREQIHVSKDQMGGEDGVYKSHKLAISSGQPPSSVSKPMPKRKPGIVRPITQGKLLRPGGPSKPRPAARPVPKAQPLPSGGVSSTPKAPPAINGGAGKSAAVPRAPPAPKAAAIVPKAPPAPSTSAATKAAAPPTRAPAPPPPPPPPAQPDVPMYKATFKFETTEDGELALQKDDLVEVVQKDDTGWWLVKKGNKEGWAPSNYLQLVEKPKPKPAVPPAPAPASVRKTPVATPAPSSVRADANAAPVSVFGTAQPGGLQAILAAKRAAADQNGESNGGSAASSRPSSSLANKPAPAPKPKPAIPSKAGVGAPPPKPKPGGGVGQMDLAAALQKRQAQMNQ